jgi:hypothetical protein
MEIINFYPFYILWRDFLQAQAYIVRRTELLARQPFVTSRPIYCYITLVTAITFNLQYSFYRQANSYGTGGNPGGYPWQADGFPPPLREGDLAIQMQLDPLGLLKPRQKKDRGLSSRGGLTSNVFRQDIERIARLW